MINTFITIFSILGRIISVPIPADCVYVFGGDQSSRKQLFIQCDLACSLRLKQTAASTETIDPAVNIYCCLFLGKGYSLRPLLKFGPQHGTLARGNSHQEAGTLHALFALLYFNFIHMDCLFLFIFLSFLEGGMQPYFQQNS